jgi:hypothetical protein
VWRKYKRGARLERWEQKNHVKYVPLEVKPLLPPPIYSGNKPRDAKWSHKPRESYGWVRFPLPLPVLIAAGNCTPLSPSTTISSVIRLVAMAFGLEPNITGVRVPHDRPFHPLQVLRKHTPFGAAGSRFNSYVVDHFQRFEVAPQNVASDSW